MAAFSLYCDLCWSTYLTFFTASASSLQKFLAVQAASPFSQPQLSSLMKLWLFKQPLLLHSLSFFCSNCGCSSCLSLFTGAAFFTDGTLAVQTAMPSSHPHLLHCRNFWLFKLPLLFHSFSFFTAEMFGCFSCLSFFTSYSFFTTLASCHVLFTWSNYFKKVYLD